jgi:hypothetical protein
MATVGREEFEFAGVMLSVVAGALHFVWGMPRGIVYLQAGRFPDPRPFLFVASALAIAGGAIWLARDGPRRPLLGGLAALMVVYLVGYAWWHLGSHGGALFGGLTPLQHEVDPLTLFVDHLLADAFVFATVVVEVAAIAALLGALLTD